MDCHLVYVSGPPGAGKSTLLAELTADCRREPAPTGLPHERLYAHPATLVGVELGCRRAQFSGTDALSMSIQPRAVQWLSTLPHRLVLAEGDRLANLKFLSTVEMLGVRVTLVDLHLPDAALALRWRERSHQDPTWRAGRVTKARRLADTWELYGGTVVHLDGTAAPAQVAARLRAAVPDLAVLPVGHTGPAALLPFHGQRR